MAQPGQMTERQEKLFLVFKKAIDAEREAQEMYKEALELCDNSVLTEILQSFYDDEVRHEKEILDQYRKFRSHFMSAD